MPPRRLVSDVALGGLLTNLLGRPIQVAKKAPAPLSPNQPLVIGLYRSDDGALVAACAADLQFAANAAAALALMPQRMVAEGSRDGRLSEGLLENFCEVLNVMCALLNSSDLPHQSFAEALTPPLELPEDVQALLGSPGIRGDFKVDISGYEGGTVTWLLA